MKQRHQMQEEEEEDVGTLSAGQQAIVGTLQMCVLLRELRTTNSDEKKEKKKTKLIWSSRTVLVWLSRRFYTKLRRINKYNKKNSEMKFDTKLIQNINRKWMQLE